VLGKTLMRTWPTRQNQAPRLMMLCNGTAVPHTKPTNPTRPAARGQGCFLLLFPSSHGNKEKLKAANQ
jgi:hypothetical protein